MKKHVLFFLAVLMSLNSMYGQWKQTYTGQSTIISEISVVNDNVIWVMDQSKTSVSYTLDGGISWVTKLLPEDLVGNSIGNFCAVNATTAFMLVSGGTVKGVYKTTDSGTNWTKQLTAFTAQSPFPDMVYFWNENDGVAVGDADATGNFEIYNTSDGGSQWNRVAAGSMPDGESDGTWNGSKYFRATANSFCFITGNGRLFKTSDKGLNWSAITTPATSGQYLSVDFKDDNNALLINKIAENIFCYTTSDGGTTWTEKTAPGYSGAINFSAAEDTYFLTGSDGLYYSDNDGLSWTKHPSFANMGVYNLKSSDTGRIFAAGLSNVFYTDNYSGENITVKSFELINSKSIDITYTLQTDPVSVMDTSNYSIKGILLTPTVKIKIKSITQDKTDQSIVHLVLDTDLPDNQISIDIKNVYDVSGQSDYSILYNGSGYNIQLKHYNTEKEINVLTPGTLLSLLTDTEKKGLESLTVTGTIDARDLRMIKDSMPAIKELDLKDCNISAYEGTDGTDDTYGDVSLTYPANILPAYSFAPSTAYNNRLISLVLPNSLTGLGDESLKYCAGLNAIEIPTLVTSIGAGAFYYCRSLTNITLPASVTSIGMYAFYYCSGLTNITLPASVTSIGMRAFYYCSGLTSFNVKSSIPVDLTAESYVFRYINTTTCTLNVPAGSKAAYESANQWTDFVNIVENLATTNKSITTERITLFPNPTTEGFYLKTNAENCKLSLFDISGRILLTGEIADTDYIDINHLPKGIYIVRIYAEGGTVEKKLVKQ